MVYLANDNVANPIPDLTDRRTHWTPPPAAHRDIAIILQGHISIRQRKAVPFDSREDQLLVAA